MGNGFGSFQNVFNSYLNGVDPGAVVVVVCRAPGLVAVAADGDDMGQAAAVGGVCWGISSWDELSD